MNLNINHTCCFTGPRPEKINENTNDIKRKLYTSIIDAINDGYKYFITGMSRGVDLWAAEIVLALAETHDISLVSAIPFINQESRWPKEDQNTYNYILSKARYTFCMSDTFFKGAYIIRNKFMVDNSTKVITYYDNVSLGGTKNTLAYALTKNKKITNIYNI